MPLTTPQTKASHFELAASDKRLDQTQNEQDNNLATRKQSPSMTILSKMNEKRLVVFPEHPKTLREVKLDFHLPGEVIIDPQGYLFCWVCKRSVDTTKGAVDMHIGAADHIQNVYRIAPTMEEFQTLQKTFNDAVIEARFAIIAREFGGPPERVDLSAFRNVVKSFRSSTTQTHDERAYNDGVLSPHNQNSVYHNAVLERASQSPNHAQEGSLLKHSHDHRSFERYEHGQNKFHTGCRDSYPSPQRQPRSLPLHSRQPHFHGESYSRGEIHSVYEASPRDGTHLRGGHPRDEAHSQGKTYLHDRAHLRDKTYRRGEVNHLHIDHFPDEPNSRDEVRLHSRAHAHEEVPFGVGPCSREEHYFGGEPHLRYDSYRRDIGYRRGRYSRGGPFRRGPSRGGPSFRGEPYRRSPPFNGEPSRESPPFHREPSRENPPFHREPSRENPPFHRELSRESPPFRGDPSCGSPPFRGEPSRRSHPFRGEYFRGNPPFHREPSRGVSFRGEPSSRGGPSRGCPPFCGEASHEGPAP